MNSAAAAVQDVAFHWLIFGHVVGVAVLGAGLGGYVVGLHRLAGAQTVADLRGTSPTLAWGERVALVGYGLLIATGIGLGAKVSAFDDAWLLTSLTLLVAVAAAGRLSSVRLKRFYELLPPSGELPPAELRSLLRASHSLAIYLPADASVLGVVELTYLMTMRPGTLGIVVSLILAAVVLAGAALALSRSAAVPEAAR